MREHRAGDGKDMVEITKEELAYIVERRKKNEKPPKAPESVDIVENPQPQKKEPETFEVDTSPLKTDAEESEPVEEEDAKEGNWKCGSCGFDGLTTRMKYCPNCKEELEWLL